MSKVILLGANWCPITKQTKELFEKLKKEMGFDYEYIDIGSNRGKELVEKFSITDVPKIIYQDRIIFHGLPPKDKLFEVIGSKGSNNGKPLGIGLFAGFIAAICCIGPLVLIVLGIGTASTALSIGKQSPYFLLIGLLFLGFAIWFYYFRRKKGVCDDCEFTRLSRKTIINIILTFIIFIITYVILVYIIIPWLAPIVYQNFYR